MELTKEQTNSIKGIAICMMLWHHLFLYTSDYGEFAQYIAELMKICVALFLFVSGYGMSVQYVKIKEQGIAQTIIFLYKRYINFFLPFWFCFILVFSIGNLFGYSATDTYPETRNTIKCVILDLWGQMGYESYLSTWWFNKLIIQLYLVFPILFLLTKTKALSIISLVLLLILQISPTYHFGIFSLEEGGFPAFFMGMICANQHFNFRPNSKQQRIIGSIGITMVGGALAFIHQSGMPDQYSAVIFRAFGALLTICLLKQNERLLNAKPLTYLGSLSATMYLTHTLIQILLQNLIYAPQLPIAIFILFLTIAVISAMAIHQLMNITRFTQFKNYLSNIIGYHS